MGKRAFTLTEVLVSVLIVGLLATIGIANYQITVDRANMMVDATNQQVLRMATIQYLADNDTLPASMGQLRPKDLERAFAQWHAEHPEHAPRWACLHDWVGLSVAEAAMRMSVVIKEDVDTGFLYGGYVRALPTFTCKSTAVHPTLSGGVVVNASYGLAYGAATMTRAQFYTALRTSPNQIFLIETGIWHRSSPLTGLDTMVVTTFNGASYRLTGARNLGGRRVGGLMIPL